MELTARHYAAFNSLGEIGERLWELSKERQGLSSDPKMVSTLLFQRLWGHFQGFSRLWQISLRVEADILLRSAIEVTICLVANCTLREEFVDLLRSDCAETLVRTIKLWREEQETDLVRDGERLLREVFGHKRDNGEPHRALGWKVLAQRGGRPELYSYHKQLSGAFTHVTGLSLLRRTAPELDDGTFEPGAWDEASSNMHLMIMAGVMALGAHAHAETIGALNARDEVAASMAELDRIARED